MAAGFIEQHACHADVPQKTHPPPHAATLIGQTTPTANEAGSLAVMTRCNFVDPSHPSF
jgi:hypothetical protein